jgi:hypothetical protein
MTFLSSLTFLIIKIRSAEVDWSEAVFHEHGNEPLGSIKCGIYFSEVTDLWYNYYYYYYYYYE